MTALLLALLVASASPDDWFDSYQRGIAAAKDAKYEESIKELSAAIAAKPEESDVAKRDDKSTVKYHPYYYRGYAYLKSGDKKNAADDLARANGRGEMDFGDLEELRNEAGPDEATASARRHRAVAASAAAATPLADVVPYIRRSNEFAVGWGTLALINAGLAQSKRRRGLVWFFLSLFLGPLATFFIVVLEPAGPRA